MGFASIVTGFAVVLLGITLVAIATVTWQHFRYLHARRGPVQDRQPMLYAPSAFHVVSLAKLAPDRDLFEEARRIVAALEGGGGRVVYAGKSLLIGLESQQLPQVEWDFALLTQYPSRRAYEDARKQPEVASALAGLEQRYDQGMHRPALLNLALPVALLARRVRDVLTRHPARYPFQRADHLAFADDPETRERARRLETLAGVRELGRDAAVVVNFVKHGSSEQREHDADYVGEMMGLMAERAHGPMHMGSAVGVEGDADFDQVALVYYPGAPYFAEMAQSSFYQSILGDKQLGDSLAMITAPFLDHLQPARNDRVR
jgi:hypothetical protein